MIAQQVTQGIKVIVSSKYRAEHSNPEAGNYIFSYHITIENKGHEPVKLLRRHWFIFDSSGSHKEVEGEGVVGQQPVINPGESYSYESACNLFTDIGSMHGIYQVQNLSNNKFIEVEIPRFELIAKQRLN